MRIIQIVLDGASEYERKCQRVDFAAFSAQHEVVVATAGTVAAQHGDVAHVYGPRELPARLFRGFPLPFVASGDVATSRWPFLKPRVPTYVVSPLAASDVPRFQMLPEAVEEAFWEPREPRTRRHSDPNIIASFKRPSLANLVEQTAGRIHRFREDVTWLLFDTPPAPDDLSRVDVWVDLAVAEDDFDGFVAEALVSGTTVVAARTPLNVQRLEQGRTGFLVPPRDPNETTHAILNALFKPEVAESKHNAADQTASKFRSRQRTRVLSRMYETLIS